MRHAYKGRLNLVEKITWGEGEDLAEVHEGGLAGALLRLVTGGLLGLGRPDLPEPRLVVDDLDVLVVQEELAGVVSRVVVVPLLEVDEHALVVGLAVTAFALHHVDALDVAKANGLDGLEHTLLGDV